MVALDGMVGRKNGQRRWGNRWTARGHTVVTGVLCQSPKLQPSIIMTILPFFVRLSAILVAR